MGSTGKVRLESSLFRFRRTLLRLLSRIDSTGPCFDGFTKVNRILLWVRGNTVSLRKKFGMFWPMCAGLGSSPVVNHKNESNRQKLSHTQRDGSKINVRYQTRR